MLILDFVDSIVTPSIKTSWLKPCTNLHYYQILDGRATERDRLLPEASSPGTPLCL